MSQPSNEARISNLEKEVISLGGRIEEAAADTAEEFRALRQDTAEDFKSLKQEIKRGHIEIGKALDSHAGSLMQEIGNVEKRLDQHDFRFDSIEKTQEEHGEMLKEILQLLRKEVSE